MTTVIPTPLASERTLSDPGYGAVRRRLDALGVDFRAADVPARFIDFCAANDDYEMEVNEAGELVILPMVGFRGNRYEYYLTIFLGIWDLENGGVGVSQTSRFRRPGGAIRGPDAAWITRERYTTPPPTNSAKPYSPARLTSWWKSIPVGTTSARCNRRCNAGGTAAPASAG